MFEEKHPRAIRWFHWLNFPLLSLMIWSGILIYWANDVYRVGLGHYTWFKLFPGSFYSGFGLGHRLAEGIAWHFFLQWLFILNGIAYVAYTLFSGEWRYLVPTRRSFSEAWLVLLHDLHLTQVVPPPRKFNGAQQIIYSAIILCGVASTLTGYAIYKPVQMSWLTWLLGGYDSARWIHFWLAITYVVFFVIHIVQVARAGLSNFLSMVTGYEFK